MVRKNIRSILGRRDDSEESGGQTPQDFGAADLEDEGRKREENNRRGGRRWLSRCCFTSCTPMETCDSVSTGEDEVDSRIHKPESGGQAGNLKGKSDGQTPGNLEGENNTADLKSKSDDPNLPMKKDGSLDWRCKENRKLLGTNEKGQPVNVTGTPDRRFKETKDEHARGQSSSKSGRTPSIAPVKKYVGTGEDEVDSRIHKPASTRKDEVDSPIAREPDYNAYLNDLREASQAGFDDLCNKANQLQPHIPPLTMKKKGKFCLNIDESSQKRIPTGKLNGDYVALRTSGDGNCFFRTASVLAFGDESKHLEMRVRIVVELACNIQYHLTVPNVEERIRVIEEYLLGTSSSKALDTSLIKVAFKGEVRETCKQFNSASHWHVEALPTVIRRPVKVVFPEGSGRIEEIFNDDIHPRDGRLILEPLVIMWTSANPSPRGGPDHFVPLVPAGEVCSPGKDLWRQYEDVLAQSQSQPTREQIKPTTSFQETTV